MAPTAVLFDIDGTLVDSNYLHVDAWSRAFEQIGRPVAAWRIHHSIGMDSDTLMDALIPEASSDERERASALHSTHHQGNRSRLRPFASARELLEVLARREVKVVLATSAPEHELQTLRATLRVEDTLDVVTSAADVGTAKPAPDIVEVALARAGTSPADAVMVGDTVWDVEASARAGIACIGVRSGGVSEGELRAAGAIAVYGDVADLLHHLESSPLAG